MLLLGIDIGTSSIKVSVVDAQTQKCLAATQYPETEREITSLEQGWAEQSPHQWWNDVENAILKAHSKKLYDPADIKAIGISYQMHGLVLVDKDLHILRDSIIWCDSRAVPYGEKALAAIGNEKCLSHLLNSPGNFTASKLAWVKENEPETFAKIHKVMLPGDYISMKLTGEVTTSVAALSEGIFWDFKTNTVSEDVMNFYGFYSSIIPTIKNVFQSHGNISKAVAASLRLPEGIPVTYKAGDQPNNALSLNVLEPGEVAATAGTSGVIYGVSDELTFDKKSRVNTFAHVNYTESIKRLGVLLCINGTGILNRWMKNNFSVEGYNQMNLAAKDIEAGCNGLYVLPFGNGAERMLENKMVQSHIQNIDFNRHTKAHLFRAGQEGIAFAFRYGLDIMRENGMYPKVIRAGKANMFISEVFIESFVNATNVPVELYECDGSVGAAIGAGIGANIFSSAKEAFSNQNPNSIFEPSKAEHYNELYEGWKQCLLEKL